MDSNIIDLLSPLLVHDFCIPGVLGLVFFFGVSSPVKVYSKPILISAFMICRQKLAKQQNDFFSHTIEQSPLQGSHISGLTKFHDISRFFKKIPGIFSEYFNVASNYFWINVYIKVSPEQNISFPQYPIVTPPLTATPQAKHMSG